MNSANGLGYLAELTLLGECRAHGAALLVDLQSPISSGSTQRLPAHLLLGSDALTLVREKLASYAAELDAWEALTRSTDFDAD